jgi:hypothetical protein
MAKDEKSIKDASAIRPGEIRWVLCKGYRCLAVLGTKGKWKCLATGKELNDVVRICVDLN